MELSVFLVRQKTFSRTESVYPSLGGGGGAKH